MFMIYEAEDLMQLKKNQFMGTVPTMLHSQISFNGKGNILYCDDGVALENCNIYFEGNDSVLYLSGSMHPYKMQIWIYHEAAVFWGENNYINHTVSITASERRNVFIGSECLFSSGVCIRNSDAHLLYDVESGKRINEGKSIYIGDHVWIGQDAMLLKGARIASGAVLGAKAVLSHKHVPSNTVWAGNPAKQIRQGVFWDGRCVHRWTQELTEASMYGKEEDLERFSFHDRPEESISYDEIERQLTEESGAENKWKVLRELAGNVGKNRFSYEKNKDE